MNHTEYMREYRRRNPVATRATHRRHYDRIRTLPKPSTFEEFAPHADRFWAKVDKSGECWLWTGAPAEKGYGYFSVHSKQVVAHRVAYVLVHGAIPDGLAIDHTCRVRLCVRPSHLEAVTTSENNRRAWESRARVTRCSKGHEFDAVARVHGVVVYRRCRTCHRDYTRTRRARAAQAEAVFG